jgi:hypothetical protein
VPDEMALHDIRMRRFSQYWRRSIRAGHAYAEVAWRRRKGIGGEWRRQVASILAYGLVLPLGFIASLVWFWPAAVIIGLLYLRLVLAITRRYVRKGHGIGLSLAYALFTAVCKAAGVIGVTRYLLGRLTGSRSRIIEYHAGGMPAEYARNPSVSEAVPPS